MTPARASSKKLADLVLDKLFAMIESRELAPGALLPSERDLMRRFEVGRPAVREALQSLANMGLVQIRHGGRARLVQPQPEQLLSHMDAAVRTLLSADPAQHAHLREARLMFESGMVRLAAARATPADLDALREALHLQAQASSDAALFVKRDIAFHVAIARLSRNPIFVALCQSLLDWLSSSSPRLLRAPDSEALTLTEHAAILAAIEAHDPDAAAFALRTHLTRTNPLYPQPSATR